jgi:AcrR family transcriptional regulator
MKSFLSRKDSTMDNSSRERLMKAAAKLFAKKGFDRVSIREIARDAKCNICLVSYYFGGKEKLYQCIVEDFFARLDLYLDTVLVEFENERQMTKDKFVEQLRFNIRFMVGEFEKDPETKIIMHREQMDGFPHIQKIFDKHFVRVRRVIEVMYERGHKLGYIRPEIHVETFAILMHRAVDAYMVSYLFTKPIRNLGLDPMKETEKFIKQVEFVFLRGVLT